MHLGAFRNTFIFACLWFLFDGLFLNQGFFSIFWLVVLTPVLLVIWIWGRVREKLNKPTNWRMKATKVLILASSAACVLVSIRLNNDMAQRRAERLGAACEQFNAKYHRYPHKLDELVPEFAPSVPMAKYAFLTSKFTYSEREHTIIFYETPPFGRAFYHIDSKYWGYLD